MGRNHTKVLVRKARKNVLATGQGAQKKKPHGKRRSLGSRRHKRALTSGLAGRRLSLAGRP